MSNVVSTIKQFKGGSMAETYLMKKQGQYFVRKLVNYNESKLGAEKLKKQWEWLFQAATENPDLFPEVGFFVYDKEQCYYDMEFIELEELRTTLLKQDPELDLNEVAHNVLIAGSWISYFVDSDQSKETYIEEQHLSKMLTRNRCIEQMQLSKLDELTVNGKRLKNLHVLIDEIRKDKELMELLKPKQWVNSHGDFTFQNVLTDEYEMRIIDPRGEGPDSVYYDISKIYQSCHGKYDLLTEGNYTAWGGPAADEINYKILTGVEYFNKVLAEFKKLIPSYYDMLDGNGEFEKNWELIVKFFEASHFLSMTPFRLKENLNITIVCYAIGLEILNEFMEEWNNVRAKNNLTTV